MLDDATIDGLSGLALDAAVAEYVFGWKRSFDGAFPNGCLKEFSTDESLAAQVREAVRKHPWHVFGMSVGLNSTWRAAFARVSGLEHITGWGVTPSEATCRAALKVKMREAKNA